jgi:uncharacterized protein (DUF2062 family)
MRAFFKRHLGDPIKRLLWEGLTPRMISESLSLGIVISVLPVLGATTILATFLALGLKKNLIAVQAGNALAAPLQLVLLLPFLKAGGAVFGSGSSLTLSVPEMTTAFKTDFLDALGRFGMSGLQGVAVWALFAPLAYFGLRLGLEPIIGKINVRPN